MKRYSTIVTLILIILILIIIALVWFITKPKATKISSTLEVLHSEQLTFLVTEKIVTQVVVNIDKSHWLTGVDKALVYTTVTMYYGVDLEKITESNLNQVDDTVYITLPEPELLDISVDLSNMQMFETRSGLVRIGDFITGNNNSLELIGNFETSARNFAKENGLIPSREKIIMQLNNFSTIFITQTGLIIIFI